jgi:hypothetical protein
MSPHCSGSQCTLGNNTISPGLCKQSLVITIVVRMQLIINDCTLILRMILVAIENKGTDAEWNDTPTAFN